MTATGCMEQQPGNGAGVLPGPQFLMSDREFARIRELVLEETGISLAPTKREMVYGRLARRLRALNMNSFRDYLELVADPNSDEMSHLVNAITTNLTAFFREPHHFEFLAKTALPEAMQRNRASARLRIWSAGCSTGEEPYSIAMVLDEALRGRKWDARILATDLDSNVIATACEGVYPLERVADVNAMRKRKYLLRSDDRVRVKPELQAYLAFRQLNLLRPWPMQGPFDVIFCRNVIIYFDRPTQQALFGRFAEMLQPGGYLLLGHSESMPQGDSRFHFLGKTVYQRVGVKS